MTDLEPRRAPWLDRRPVPRPQVDLYKSRGLDLTPEEVRARRSNRRWMLVLAGVAGLIFVLVLIADGVSSGNEFTGPRITAPPGYKVENDSYYAYVVPDSWSNNPAGTDVSGDVETSGPSGWVGENISYYKTATPTLYEASRPTAIEAWNEHGLEPYSLTDGHAITVKGASGAFEYLMTRPGGFRAVVVDSWFAQTDVELWLVVDAPPAVTAQLVSSLTAGETR